MCTKGTSQVVMSLKCLDKIYRKARHKVYLEHVENYCLENWKNFKIDYQIVDKKIYFKNLNFSIDQKKDVTFIEKNNIKSLFQRNIPKINNKINNKIRGKNIYSVAKGKFLKKNRIGYYLLSNFFKPNENINIKKKKINKKFFFDRRFLIKKIFTTQFVDDFKNIYLPNLKKKKFNKIKFKNNKDKSWNSYFMQKKRIILYRRLNNLV